MNQSVFDKPMWTTTEYEVFPNKKQEKILLANKRCCIMLWNGLVEETEKVHDSFDPKKVRTQIRNLAKAIKSKNPFIELANYQPICATERTFMLNFVSWKYSDGKKPKIKSEESKIEIKFTSFHETKNTIKVADVGFVQTDKRPVVKGKLTAVSFIFKNNKWYGHSLYKIT